MSQKGKNIALTVLGYAVSIAICLAAWGLGLASQVSPGTGKALWGTSVVLLIGMAVANAVCRSRFKGAMNRKSAQELYEGELRYKEETDASPETREKSINGYLAAAAVWEAAVILLLLAGCFFAGCGSWPVQSEEPGTMFTVSLTFSIIAVFVLEGYVSALLKNPDEKPEGLPSLTREEFPLAYALVQKAAEAAGIRKKLRIYLVPDGFAVSEQRGCVNVFFNGQIFSILTDEEAYAVLLHEFAHVRNEDTLKSAKRAGLGNRLRLSPEEPIAAAWLLFGWFSERAAFEAERGALYDNRRREILADAFVRESGLAQAYVNATAKATLYALYSEETTPEYYEAIFAGEKYPDDICGLRLSVFEQYLEKRGERWDFILRHELTKRVDSHPTFRMRMEHMGKDDYDVSARETDPESRKERDKMRRLLSDLTRAFDELRFDEMRKDWNESLENRRKFEEAERTGADVTTEELIRWADSLQGIYDDCVFRMAERLEKKNPGSALAAYYKGWILAGRGDEACLPLLYHAAEEADFADAAMERAGMFCVRSGNQALLDDYRARTVPTLQKVMDDAERNKISPFEKFEPCDIPEELFRPFLERLVSAGNGVVRKIWVGVRRKEGKNTLYAYLVRFCRVPVGKGRKEILEKIFKARSDLYLCLTESGLPEEYRRFVLFYEEAIPQARHIRRAGAPVYEWKKG